MSSSRYSTFISFAKITLILLYLLILAGAVVRATGSGMGCPDWPRCFGQIVPPTDVSQLPENYKEIYKVGNHEIATFNVVHTWVEYINRLLGVLIGFSVFILFLLSLKHRKEQPGLVCMCLSIFLLVGIEGVLGKHVVDTNLSPGIITLHMILALIILALLIYVVAKAEEIVNPLEKLNNKRVKLVLIFALVISLVQVALGTQVREAIDVIAVKMMDQNRESWIDQLGFFFNAHKWIAIGVILINLYLFFLIRNATENRRLLSTAKNILIIVGCEFILGLILAHLAVPAAAQPIHLLLATILFGIQFKLFVQVNKLT